MVLDVWLTEIERRLASWGLPAGPDHLINHKVILCVFAGLFGAIIGWILTEPYREDFGFWRDFLILAAVGFFICLPVMSTERIFDAGLRAFIRNLGTSAVYTFVIIVPTALAVKLILEPIPPNTTKVLLLDTSGSMEGYPLQTLKKALNVYLDAIEKVGARSRTAVACVAFDTHSRIICRPATDYDSFRTKVEQLKAGGIKNMPAAFDTAKDLLKEENSRKLHGHRRIPATDTAVPEDILIANDYHFPKDFNLEDYLQTAFHVMRGNPERVKVRFNHGAAQVVRERIWHPTQEIRELVDGGVEIALEVPINYEIVSWILGFGSAAKVIQPFSLRSRISGELKKAASRYREPRPLAKGYTKRILARLS